MNTPLRCKIIAHGDTPHLSQVYTGFSLLQQFGKITLQYVLGDYRLRGKKFCKHTPPLGGVYVYVNDAHLMYYDVRDGADFDTEALNIADYYFKRSYSQAQIPEKCTAKVMPLGLNYEIYPDKPGMGDFRKLLNQPRWSKYFLRRIAQVASQLTGYPFLFVPTLSRIQAIPDVAIESKILFMTQAWDPNEIADLPEVTRNDRHAINAMRAECVRLLRQAFGQRFYGGFAHSEYAAKHYPDVLLPDHALSSKAKYLDLLKNHPICIATTGLHGSVGWKFGEYVAFSRAIVSEKLVFPPPYGFSPDCHYLEFSTPQQCVAAVESLVSDDELRLRLMQNNHDYYKQYLKPDRLVEQTLAIALGGG